jgi:hypothetical protein
MGTLIVLSPAVMPWYLLWLLPLATLSLAWPWVVFSAAACLAFLVMVDGRERLWWLAVEYAALGAACCPSLRNERFNVLDWTARTKKGYASCAN